MKNFYKDLETGMYLTKEAMIDLFQKFIANLERDVPHEHFHLKCNIVKCHIREENETRMGGGGVLS